MIAVDTNLLIYAHRTATPQHAQACAALSRAAADPRGWGIPLSCIGEFWMVVTHKSTSGRPSTSDEAAGFLQGLAESGGAEFWAPTDDIPLKLLRFAQSSGVSSARIFDVLIALTALEAGATELWTYDKRFVAVPGLQLTQL